MSPPKDKCSDLREMIGNVGGWNLRSGFSWLRGERSGGGLTGKTVVSDWCLANYCRGEACDCEDWTIAAMGFCLGLVIDSRMPARGAVLENSIPFEVDRTPSWAQSAGRSYWTGASF